MDRIWILNVGGTRLVLDVAYMPQATQADRQALFFTDRPLDPVPPLSVPMSSSNGTSSTATFLFTDSTGRRAC